MARLTQSVTCPTRSATQPRVNSLEAELETEKAQKLDAKNASAELTTDLGREKAKVLTLDKELTGVRKNLEA
jgi:hypothetical protein